MEIKFYKYQGTGNDFVIFDNRDKQFDNITAGQIKTICDRRFGIGGDGLILLNEHTDHDFEMKYWNADGKEGSMCGNGGRCLVKFASQMGAVKSTYRFLAIDGIHEARLNEDGTIALKMNDVENIKQQQGRYILDTGSPHFVEMTTDVMHMDVFEKGRKIRYSPEFAEKGINVNFVEQTSKNDKIIVRTYERGVEDETFSCGTGVTAAALVCSHNENGFNRVEVKTKGGYLSVEYEKAGNSFKNIWLNGPAEKVFEGVIDI